MFAFFIASLFVSFIHSQSTIYYVSTNGSDTSSCGAQVSPCASINQVIRNDPINTYAISIASGTYAINSVILSKGQNIDFRGATKDTIINADVGSTLLSLATGSGFSFHDVTIFPSGIGYFTTLLSADNSAEFYNIVFNYTKFSGDLVDMNGGTCIFSNISLNGGNFNSSFILGLSDEEDSNVTITGSSFSNINIGEDGGILYFDSYGAANIAIDNTSFTYINCDYWFIAYWAEDFDQNVNITNSIFNNTLSYLSSVCLENNHLCVIYVANTSWNNVSSNYVVGALETLGPDDRTDHNITLVDLTFTNCFGVYAGALLVGYNSLRLSGSVFRNNSGSSVVGNDVVQVVDDQSASFPYSIVDSVSSSAQRRAVVWNLSSSEVTDISYLLPDPSFSPDERVDV